MGQTWEHSSHEVTPGSPRVVRGFWRRWNLSFFLAAASPKTRSTHRWVHETICMVLYCDDVR